MKNRIEDAVKEYNSKDWKGTEAAFFASDLDSIYQIYKNKGIYDAIWGALEAGFMIGYRKGCKDKRKRIK